MAFDRTRRVGAAANRIIGDLAGRVDGETGAVAAQVARTAAFAVRLLRFPTLAVLIVPVPFILATFAVAIVADGLMGWLVLIAALAMTAVSVAFGWRRYRILEAVTDLDALTTELGIAISLSDKVGDTRRNLREIAGPGQGWQLFSRLRGMWRTARMPVQWIDSVGDLPRARYFLPPRIGTTIAVTMAALWLVPISVLIALFTVVGALARAL